MTFHLSQSPLLFSSWIPKSTWTLIITCLSIVVFSFLWRGIGLYSTLVSRRARTRRQFLSSLTTSSTNTSSTTEKNEISYSEYPQNVQSQTFNPQSSRNSRNNNDVRDRSGTKTAWRWSTDAVPALITTVHTTWGLIVMLVAMTMNGYYFLSIILGVLLGEIYFGRFN